MLGKKKYAILGLIALLALVAVAGTWPHAPSPAPFGQYLVYSAAGVYDASIPPEEALPEVGEWGNLADWFHRGVMGRDDAALAQEEAEADAYFQATFGDNYEPGSLFAFGFDPRNEYRAYFISGARVPPEGWVVRDGGFMAILDDGGMVVYGDYNIEVTAPGRGQQPDPIIIHYESASPIYPNPDGSLMFLCRLSSEDFDDFGGGLAQGISAPENIDGMTVANIRNILTFPGLGFDAP